MIMIFKMNFKQKLILGKKSKKLHIANILMMIIDPEIPSRRIEN